MSRCLARGVARPRRALEPKLVGFDQSCDIAAELNCRECPRRGAVRLEDTGLRFEIADSINLGLLPR